MWNNTAKKIRVIGIDAMAFLPLILLVFPFLNNKAWVWMLVVVLSLIIVFFDLKKITIANLWRKFERSMRGGVIRTRSISRRNSLFNRFI
jgi:hypothetical protein